MEQSLFLNPLFSGRQSPGVSSKPHPKITSSPIVRRVRKSSTGKPQPPPSLGPGPSIRKSVSMDNVGLQRQLERQPPAAADTQEVVEADGPEAGVAVAVPEEEQRTAAGRGSALSASYSTLPHSRSFSRSKNISRSLVPKMRKFFEKSRSCDPDLPHVKIRIHSEPNNGSATGSGHRGRVAVSDGTESTRSSFVLLGPDTCGDRSSSPPPSPSSPLPDIEDASPDRGPEEDEGRGSAETVAEEKLPRGFVNKCVTKVRSFMGRSGQERD